MAEPRLGIVRAAGRSNRQCCKNTDWRPDELAAAHRNPSRPATAGHRLQTVALDWEEHPALDLARTFATRLQMPGSELLEEGGDHRPGGQRLGCRVRTHRISSGHRRGSPRSRRCLSPYGLKKHFGLACPRSYNSADWLEVSLRPDRGRTYSALARGGAGRSAPHERPDIFPG